MRTHDKIVQSALRAMAQINREAVLAAFVGSLATRNLSARSAFGSYVILQHFTTHEFRDSAIFSMGYCAHCGVPPTHPMSAERRDEWVARYPFQVRHTQIVYASHDLTTFADRRVDAPTEESTQMLRDILEALRSLPESAQLSELQKAPQGIIKSNKHERTILLETLGYAGILCPPDREHWGSRFIQFDEAESQQPSNANKRDWAYPTRFWSGAAGVQEAWVKHWFGEYL